MPIIVFSLYPMGNSNMRKAISKKMFAIYYNIPCKRHLYNILTSKQIILLDKINLQVNMSLSVYCHMGACMGTF